MLVHYQKINKICKKMH